MLAFSNKLFSLKILFVFNDQKMFDSKIKEKSSLVMSNCRLKTLSNGLVCHLDLFILRSI
jgi:hypothetical protein